MTGINSNGISGTVPDASAAENIVRFAAAAGAVTRTPLVVACDGTPAARLLMRAVAAAVCSRGCPVLSGGVLYSGAVRDLLTRRECGGALLVGSPAPGRIGVRRLGADGRDADGVDMETLWDAYDNGTAPGTPAEETPLAAAPVIAGYLDTLEHAVDAAAIRRSAMKCAIDFANDAAASLAGEMTRVFGLEVLGFQNSGTAAAQAARQLGLSAAFGFSPSGDALLIGSPDGVWLPSETAFAVAAHYRCRCIEGGQVVISGGNGLLVEEAVRRAGGKHVAGDAAGDFYGVDGSFGFGGFPGFDVFRMMLLLLEAAAVNRRPPAEWVHLLPPLHLVDAALPWNEFHMGRITALRGRLGDARMSCCGDTCRFEESGCRVSCRPDPASGTLAIRAAARKLSDARERAATIRQLLGGGR